jgi:hypothetical protein
MITASKLAGFFAAHAIWCVSDGETLIPMLAYTTEKGERNMERFAADDLGTSVAQGRQKLEANPMNATDAALLSDGRITLPDGKVDAIIVEIRAYFSPKSEAVIVVPYTPKSSGRFRVHKPKLAAWKNCDDFDRDAMFQNFFAGVDEHEKGARIWNASLDQSK